MSNQHSPAAIMLCVLVLTILLFMARSVQADNSAEALFTNGQQSYAAGDYTAAKTAFETAVTMAPDNARYHHWLGKCYGRMAESAGIFAALELSKRTRLQLEHAVELDDSNIPALEDLMKYYQQAPGFLGGGAEKAAAVCRRLQELQNNAHGDDNHDPESC